MADSSEFFVKSQSEIYEEAYLDYRDRLATMRRKDMENPKKMAGMKRAVAEKFDLEIDEIQDILDEYDSSKINPLDPKTWRRFEADKVDIGRGALVDERVALAEEVAIYKKQAQALGNPTLELVEGEVGAFGGRVLSQADIDSKSPSSPLYRDNYNRTMSAIYQDVLDGVDPIESLARNVDTLGLPEEFGDTLFEKVKSINKMMIEGADTAEAVPYPKVTQDVIDLLTDRPMPIRIEPDPVSESRLRGSAVEAAKAATGPDLSTLSDEELASSKARIEKELEDLNAESRRTEETLAEARKEKERLKAREKPKEYFIGDERGTRKVVDDPLKVGTKADLPVIHSARDTTKKLPKVTKVADSISSSGTTARVTATAADVIADAASTAGTAASAASSGSARALHSGASVASLVTKGPAGAIALGVAAAGLLLGKSVSSKNKSSRADTSAMMNAQQRYRR